MTGGRPSRRTARAIFAAPLAVAALSIAGLVSALLGDGAWDGLSWLLLIVPVALCLGYVVRGVRVRRAN